MDRRTFLKTTTVAAATSGTAIGVGQVGASPANLAPRVEWQVAATPEYSEAAHRFAQQVAAASGGSVVIHLQEAHTARGRITAGGLDGVFGNLAEICAAPEMDLFTGLPGKLALAPEQLLAWHEAAGGDLYLDAAAGRLGLAAFIVGHSGAGIGLWASEAIADLGSLAEADIAATGLGGAIFDRMSGVAATSPRLSLVEMPLPPMQAYLALPENRRRIWYRDGLHGQGIATALVLRREVWDAIDPAMQELVATLARAAAHGELARIRVGERLMAPSVMASLPLRREPLAHDVATALQHTAVDTVFEALAGSPLAGQAFEAYAAFFAAMIGAPLPRPVQGAAGVV